MDTVLQAREHNVPSDDHSTVANTCGVRQQRSRRRGQSMVEFALLVPLLMLILALSADFGRAFTAYIAIGSAAGAGATYGMQSLTQAQDATNIRQIALASAPDIWGVTPTVSSGPCSPADTQGYNCVQVQVNYTFSPILRIPPIQNSYTLTRIVRMRVIG